MEAIESQRPGVAPVSEPRGPRRALLGLGVAALAALAAWSLYGLLASSWAGGPVITVRGLRLGLTPTQARSALQTDGPGRFRSSTAGEDLHLDWTPDGEEGDLRAARLEFHLGLLVAARLSLGPDAPEGPGPPLVTTDASVLRRAPGPAGGVELTWLARGCPTHAEEVARLLARTHD